MSVDRNRIIRERVNARRARNRRLFEPLIVDVAKIEESMPEDVAAAILAELEPRHMEALNDLARRWQAYMEKRAMR